MGLAPTLVERFIRLPDTRAIFGLLACSMVTWVTMLGGPVTAQGALEVHTDYKAPEAMPAACIRLGQADDNGVMYLACANRIVRWDRNGTKLADISLAGMGLSDIFDVAPSPDGSYLYISQGVSPPRRLVRANDVYTLDKTWKLSTFTYWGITFAPSGYVLATDGRGDIYLSNGSMLSGLQRSIVKYAPNGQFITAFGDWGREPGNWVANQGVAVSRDGRRVYVGENCSSQCNFNQPNYQPSRVTRYDFNAGGTYRFSRIISAQGPFQNRPFADCPDPGAVHSGYALAMDVRENLYVTSTTCGRVQMFKTDADPAKDQFVRSVAWWNDATARNHYVSSDWAGRLYLTEWNKMLTPKVTDVPQPPLPPLAPLPEPDVIAPTVTALTMPATTSTSTVTLTVNANDNTGVTEMQLAREDGNWGPWQPFASPASYTLTDGLGVRGVYVRVRDMAGNESNSVYRTISVVAPVEGEDPNVPPPVADAADPVLVSIAIPVLTPTNEISVTIEATDDTGVRSVRMANEDGVWSQWRAFNAVMDWNLSPNQGAKALYVQVRDGAGRESVSLMARTRVQADAPPPPPPGEEPPAPDATAPVLTSVTIPAETTTAVVEVAMAATDDVDVSQVRFANEDGNWTAWKAWNPTTQWQLSAGFGAKLIYAQVRDAAGNESAVLTARSSLVKTAAGPADAVDPALVRVTLPETSQTQAITVSLEATDDIGVTQVRFANEDGVWGQWKPYAGEVTHTLSAGNTLKVVYAQVRDAAGRESNVLFSRTQVVA